MSVKPLIRGILGFVFALLGYLGAQNYLTYLNPPGFPYLIQNISAFLAGLFGVFLLPILGYYLASLYSNFVYRVAAELVNQIQSRLTLPSMPSLNVRRRKKPENGEKYHNPMVLDTSAIIDGRILDIVETGFLSGTLLVPNFVLTELQQVSDSPNSLKRGRGRRGFEILETLKKSKNLKTEIINGEQVQGKDADDKLVHLAKQLKAKIITCDYNLNKVASLSGVKILNVNELSNSLKTIVLPGESLNVKVIQEGKEKSQGVGYLPDGTMIVVEKGNALIGKSIEVNVSRVIQTVAGRMIFATVKN